MTSMTTKFIIIDADVDSFDSVEEALAALATQEDGRTPLYNPALLVRAEIVTVLVPAAVQVPAGGWPDMKEWRAKRDDRANASTLGKTSAIGRGVPIG